MSEQSQPRNSADDVLIAVSTLLQELLSEDGEHYNLIVLSRGSRDEKDATVRMASSMSDKLTQKVLASAIKRIKAHSSQGPAG